MLNQSISTLLVNYGEEIKEFFEELNKENFPKTSKWKYPLDWHVTSLFIGGNKSLINDPIHVNFKENENISVDIEGLVFVPNKIICCICFPKTEIKNKIPHVTIMTNGWKAKESNTVCEALFVDGPFMKEYDTVFKNNEYKDKFVEKVNLKLLNENLNVYLIKFEKLSIKINHFSNAVR